MKAFDLDHDAIDAIARQLPTSGRADLVFEAPWQSRIFAIVVALVKDGRFPWKDFQSQLVKEISDAETGSTQKASTSLEGEYFRHWLTAVEATLKEFDFANEGDVENKVADLRSEAGKIRDLQLKHHDLDD